MEKTTEKSRYRLYKKITAEIDEINKSIVWAGIQISTNTEYVPDYLKEVLEQLRDLWQLDENTFVHGKGKRKTPQQRQYEMEKYRKFPMYKKETKDSDYHKNPFRAVNFPIGEDGIMRCPNGRAFQFQYRRNVRGNQYGRQEEIYRCEDCSGCPYAERCCE